MVEHAAREQRGRQQGARLLGQFFDVRSGACAHHPAAGENDRASRLRELLDQRMDLARVGRDGAGARQDGG